jgi:hypothetical protein
MRLQSPTVLAGGFALLLSAGSASAQATFQNLGFESANLAPIPPGQFGGEVSSLDALLYWTCFIGTNQVTQVLQNSFTIGQASIDILGPYWSFGGIIEGQFTVVLQPGAGGSGNNVGASISQTGLVPSDAQSIQFKGQTSSPFSVSLAGQNLSIIPLGTFTTYTLYGANIPLSAAGQVQALTITALAGPSTTELFDSFVFSSSPTPEPGTAGLFALGAMLVGSRVLRRQR